MRAVDHRRRPGLAQAPLRSVYRQPDPRPYFRAMGDLDYVLPDLARPILRRLIRSYREAAGRQDIAVVDVGCSYGINAALLRMPLTFERLRRRYALPEIAAMEAEEVLTLDRLYYHSWPFDPDLGMIGIDASGPAISYALECGLIRRGIAGSLDRARACVDDVASLHRVDMVISTGCIGYVSARTFERLFSCVEDGRRPWVACFVPRACSYDEIASALRRHGLTTEKLEGKTFIQRRFLDAREQGRALAALDRLAIDPSGKEAAGFCHAELYVSRPPALTRSTSLNDLLESDSKPDLPIDLRGDGKFDRGSESVSSLDAQSHGRMA